MSAHALADLVGKTLSRFRILEWIGAGGMGVVYRAQDTELRRDVAIKVLPPEQIRGLSVDHRTDLLSLGVMLYEMLSGRLPWDGTTNMEVLIAATRDEPPALPTSVGRGCGAAGQPARGPRLSRAR